MIDIVNYYGVSGTHYQFQLHPIGTPFLNRAGVYIFVRQMPDGRWDALYVGETSDFDQRLNSGLQHHDAWPSVCSYRGTHLCLLAVPGTLADRERIETDLRHALNPLCNRQTMGMAPRVAMRRS